MSTRVSVIIPAYNYARYLPRCVDSVRRQTYAEWECIVVDDGSTDDTPGVCRQLAAADARVLFVRQENRGLSAARNAGIARAIGEYVQFLDADDMLEPYKLEAQVRYLDASPATDIVVGDAAYFSDDEAKDLRPWPVDRSIKDSPLATLVADNPFVVNAALIRHRLLDSVGLFDEALIAHEDWDLWLRCALAGCRFGVVSASGSRALVRQHAASMSAAREKMLKNAMLVRKRLAARLPQQLQALNAERLSEMQCAFGLELMRAGRLAEGWAFYREGLALARNKTVIALRLLYLLPGTWQLMRFARKRSQ